jgi:SpoVK/Ycf46/Vps4 family AAA+-type ATPase
MLDVHPWLGDPRVVRALRDLAATRRDLPLVLIMPTPTLPPELDRDARVLTLPLPDGKALAAGYDAEKLDPRWPRDALIRGALGLTQDEAARAFRLARAAATPAEGLRVVIAEKRGALRRSACLDLIDPEITLEDVGGLEVLKSWLRARVLAFDAGAHDFGLSEPRGMLVCGVQGCGKSLVSKATAAVLGLPLVRLDFAEVFAAASAEHAIHEAMRAVEAVAPVVLWVDEIEKGLGAEAADARNARVFGAFLTWLQERRAPVFVAATANEVDRLPPELARRGRFDEVFFVDLPSTKERLQILTVHLRRRGREPESYPLEELTRTLEHWSGAEIEQMVQSALFRAYAEKRELSVEHLRAATRELVPLATLYEEKIQALRQWGETRARRASADRRTLDLFGD